VCLGIYGLVAHAASQRTREMAVRAALGAQRTGLVRLMLGRAGRVIAAGTVVGLAASIGVASLLETQLVEIPAIDPVTFGAAVALLSFFGMLAALVPSLKAARLDPIEALRRE
jgi:putative ABC transport system permease protein